MNNKIKEYIFILFISLFPVTLTLISLKLNNYGYFNTQPYYYIISLFTIILLITFTGSCIIIINDLIKRDEFALFKNLKISLLLLFSLLYPPFHYLYNYHKKYFLLSFIILFINISSLIFFYQSFNDYVSKLEIINVKRETSIRTKYDYFFDKDKFKLEIDMDYSCNRKLGDYVLSCEDSETDSFIGIYSYNLNNHSEKDLNDIYSYHLNQTIGYIEEAGYDYEISDDGNVNILKYSDMTIYITFNDYDLNDDKNMDYRLIIINETSNDNINYFYNLIYGIKVNK